MSTFFRYDLTLNAANGFALTGVIVYVCTQPAITTTIPPSPLATIYSDNAGTDPIDQVNAPLETDGNGNAFFYAATGTYTVVYFDPSNGITPNPMVFADQQVVSPGGGSVTSVALTMPGEFSVVGSPISSSGTFAVSKSNQNANTIYAGPASGPAAPPTFRSAVSADFPAGVGTVTSVAIALNGSALLSLSSSGGPITTSGTVTLTVNFANQSANTVLAGPASGGSGPVTARALVAADIFGVVSVSASPTPTLNLALEPIPTFVIPVGQNITSLVMQNPTPGQLFVIKWVMNGTGGYTVTFPNTFFGQTNVDNNANAVTTQTFVCISSSEFRMTDPGSTNQS